MTDMVDLDKLPPAPPEMAEFIALSRAKVLLERIGDWLAGGMIVGSLMLLPVGAVWILLLVVMLPLLMLMVAGAGWVAKRRMNRLSDAMADDEEN